MNPDNVPDRLMDAAMPAFYGIPPEAWASMTRDDQDEATRIDGRTVRRIVAAVMAAESEHTA